MQGSVPPFVPWHPLWHNKITTSCQQYLNPQTGQNSISWPNKVCIKSVRAAWDFSSSSHLFPLPLVCLFLHLSTSWGGREESSSLAANNSYFFSNKGQTVSKWQKWSVRRRVYFTHILNRITGYYHGYQTAVWKAVSICEGSKRPC